MLNTYIEINLFQLHKEKMSVKCLLVGDSGVGKSALIRKLKADEFIENHIPTVGVEVHPVVIENVKINVWDCAGDERYVSQGDCAIIVYDKNPENVNMWKKAIIKACGYIPIVVCKNKEDEECKIHNDSSDVEDDYSEYLDEFKEYRSIFGDVHHMEENDEMLISAKYGEGLLTPLKKLLKMI